MIVNILVEVECLEYIEHISEVNLSSVNELLSYWSYWSYLILFLPNSCHLDHSKMSKFGPGLYNANNTS